MVTNWSELSFQIAAGAAIMTARSIEEHAAAYGVDTATHEIDPTEVREMLERGDKDALAAALPEMMRQATAGEPPAPGAPQQGAV